MEFTYETKETYSQEDVNKILDTHKKHVSKQFEGFVSPDKYKEVEGKLQPYIQKEATETANKFAKENGVVDIDTFSKLKSHDKFMKLETPEERKEFLSKLKNDEPSLFKTEQALELNKKTIIKKPQEKKDTNVNANGISLAGL